MILSNYRKYPIIIIFLAGLLFLTSCMPGRHYQRESHPKREVTICFMGDVMMDSYFGWYVDRNGVDYPWVEVSRITNRADISVINLETSVSTRGEPVKPPAFAFRSEPHTLEGLVNAGIDLVSIANNHVLDYGPGAFFDTMGYLEKYGIKYAGGGADIYEAESPVFIEKNGIRIAFLAYTSIIPDESWRAAPDSPGIAPLSEEDYSRVLTNISKVSEESDILVVMLHWGYEYIQKPSEAQKKLARSMIDHGADVIVGHHPHVLQGIEFYKEKPIFYSIGNFLFLKRNHLAGLSGIFELTFDEYGFQRGRIHPVFINRCRAELHNSETIVGREIIDMLADLSGAKGSFVDSYGYINSSAVYAACDAKEEFAD